MSLVSFSSRAFEVLAIVPGQRGWSEETKKPHGADRVSDLRGPFSALADITGYGDG